MKRTKEGNKVIDEDFFKIKNLQEVLSAACAIVDSFPEGRIDSLEVFKKGDCTKGIPCGSLNAERLRDSLIALGIFEKKI